MSVTCQCVMSSQQIDYDFSLLVKIFFQAFLPFREFLVRNENQHLGISKTRDGEKDDVYCVGTLNVSIVRVPTYQPRPKCLECGT